MHSNKCRFLDNAWNAFNSRSIDNSTTGSGENRKAACTVCRFNRGMDQRPHRHRNSPVSDCSCIPSCSYDNAVTGKADSLRAELESFVKASACIQQQKLQANVSFCIFWKDRIEKWMSCCVYTFTKLLSVQVLSVAKRHCGAGCLTLTVFPLILVLLLIILSSAPIKPSKPDMAEPAEGEAAQSITTRQGWRH